LTLEHENLMNGDTDAFFGVVRNVISGQSFLCPIELKGSNVFASEVKMLWSSFEYCYYEKNDKSLTFIDVKKPNTLGKVNIQSHLCKYS